MILSNKTLGRPKGSTEPEVKILAPDTQKGFMKLRRGTRAMANINKAKKESAEFVKKTTLKLKLQTRYYNEFEVIGYNKYGLIMEHPKLKLLGRVYQLQKSTNGDRLEEYYFPERFSEEKLQRRLKNLKRRYIRKGITEHDLRMHRVPEDQIKLIFNA
jgi:hypothetical protein